MAANLPGSATRDGTLAYAARFADLTAEGHFRRLGELSASSIGLGTYLGPANDQTDASYRGAIVRALGRGINVLDTASNYRHQRSERAIGAGLAEALERGLVARSEVIVASKAGFLAFDGARPADPRAYLESMVEAGLFAWHDVAAGCHTLTPRYLRHTIDQSRRNLGLDTIDIYYLHNPETQLDEVTRDVFGARMHLAFEALEQACRDGAIACYGAATWSGFRVPPGDSNHLSMADLVGMARDVAGDGHHLRVIQLPYNMTMPEARDSATQRIEGAEIPALEAAAHLGLYVMSSASIEQGKLASRLPRAAGSSVDGLHTPAQRALQFARSAPGMGTALVGMKSSLHVDENALVARIEPVEG